MSHPVLSPEEINALMEGFDSSPTQEPRADKSEALSLPQLFNHPWSALDIVHKRFAAQLALHLSRQCGRQLDVVSRPAVEVTHGRFVSELAPMHVAFNAPFSSGPGRVLAILDEEGVRRYTDLLFGGDGFDVSAQAVGLSPVEQSVARGLMRAVFQMYAQASGQALVPDLVSTSLGPEREVIGCAMAGTRMVDARFVISVGSIRICMVIAKPTQQEARQTDVDGTGRTVARRTLAWTSQVSGDVLATWPQTAVAARKGAPRPNKPRIRTAIRGARVGAASDSRRVHTLAWTGRTQ